jgi:hypothetical protein
MHCPYDGGGNSIPTILLQMQRRLYDHGGLAAEKASSGSPPTTPRSSTSATSSTPASCHMEWTCTASQASSRLFLGLIITYC